MPSYSALAIAAGAVVLILTSAFWAERRFHRFATLPAHFTLSCQASRLAPRRFVLWLTPCIMVALLIIIIGTIGFLPPEAIKGDPSDAVVISSLLILGSQALILWLIERWAKRQS